MKDSDLIRIFRQVIVDGLALNGWSYPVTQRSQPTQQGVSTETSVYFQKLFDYRYGMPCMVVQTDVPEIGKNTEVVTQNMETTFQVSAMVLIDPSINTSDLITASDVSNYVANILQRRDTVRKLLMHGVNVLRVGKVDNTYFEDDRHRNEAWPTFEVVLTHKTVTSNIVNNTDDVKLKVYRVPD